MAEIPDRTFEALVDANVAHARATGQIAEVLRQHSDRQTKIEEAVSAQTPILKQIADTLVRAEKDAEDGREEAVARVIAASELTEKKQKNLILLVAGACFLAQVAGVGVENLMKFLPK